MRSSLASSRALLWWGEEGLALERELQQHLFQSEDAREGLAAYVEKRTPNFKAK